MMPIPREFARDQVLRLAGLPYFPQVEAALGELIDAICECGDPALATRVVDEVRDWETCPTPGDLRQVRRRLNPPESPDSCGRCHGGWVVVRVVDGVELFGRCKCRT